MVGQANSKKIMYFQHFSKTIQYFFLVISRPLRRVFKTFSEKNSKKKVDFFFIKKFHNISFFYRIFDFLRTKYWYFQNISKTAQYFFGLFRFSIEEIEKYFL